MEEKDGDDDDDDDDSDDDDRDNGGVAAAGGQQDGNLWTPKLSDNLPTGSPLLDPPCYCAAATSTLGTPQPNVLLLFLSDGAPRSWAAATQCTTTTTAAVRCAVFARRPLLLSSPRATVWQNASAWPAWARATAKRYAHLKTSYDHPQGMALGRCVIVCMTT